MTFAEELAQNAIAAQNAAAVVYPPHIARMQELCRKAAAGGKTCATILIGDLTLRDGVKPNFEKLAAYARNEWHMGAVTNEGFILLDWAPTK